MNESLTSGCGAEFECGSTVKDQAHRHTMDIGLSLGQKSSAPKEAARRNGRNAEQPSLHPNLKLSILGSAGESATLLWLPGIPFNDFQQVCFMDGIARLG